MPRSPSSVLINRSLLRRWPLPQPRRGGDKEERGRVVVVGGARQMPGPMILAATAALRAGAGKLQIATVGSVAAVVAAAVPEAMVHGVAEGDDGAFARQSAPDLVTAARAAQAILIGPGMLENPLLRHVILDVILALDDHHTVILDAAAMTVFGGQTALLARTPTGTGAVRRCQLVLTPHAGEMATLLAIDKAAAVARPGALAMQAARALDAVVVHKGAETYVSDGKETFRNTAGNVGLGTSGSGDVLGGIIAGLAARGAPPLQAAAWGVYLHATAGDRLLVRHGPLGYLARELAAEVPRLMADHAASPRGHRR